MQMPRDWNSHVILIVVENGSNINLLGNCLAIPMTGICMLPSDLAIVPSHTRPADECTRPLEDMFGSNIFLNKQNLFIIKIKTFFKILSNDFKWQIKNEHQLVLVLNLNGAWGGTWTHTVLPPSDFESDTSTIPSLRHKKIIT